ncbi:MAG: peroxiredoxin [Prochlorococcaceae cyanobacterium]
MNRRELLGCLGLFPLVLALHPAEALALGGVLPPLDQPAPDFDLEGVLPSGKGKASKAVVGQRSLADFGGRWLVLYFYPRDFTGGCTLEARGFQRDLVAFHQAGAEVVGISADDPESHASFCGSEELTFPLLSDPGGQVSQSYGSWIAPFSQRHTFLIDPEGILRSNWLAVRPQGHSQEVLEALRKLQTTPLSRSAQGSPQAQG